MFLADYLSCLVVLIGRMIYRLHCAERLTNSYKCIKYIMQNYTNNSSFSNQPYSALSSGIDLDRSVAYKSRIV